MTTHKNHQLQQQIINAFEYRHATKLFDENKKVSDQAFHTLLEVAQLSPSSFGFEPWKMLVVQSQEKRELFRDFSWGANGLMNGTKGQLGTASHFVIFLAHTEITMQHHSDYLQSFMRDVKKLPEDVIDLFNQAYQKFQEEDFQIEGRRQVVDWSAKQAYIALANMMSTAAMLGIDSCPMEGFDLQQTSAVLEEHFGVDPEHYQPAVMVAFGYRAQEPAFDKSRREIEQFVEWF